MTTTLSPAQGALRAKNLILAMILIGQLMIILDASIVTTALPAIQSSLHFSSASLSWVQNAYTLFFGGLLVLGARIGDILGRRRTFTAGIAVFTLASLAGGLAQSSEWLLISRSIQGMAAAVAAPSTLALLMQTFTEPKERARAIALFSGVLGAGASFGVVLGGILTDLISWRWGLFINVPIGIALVILAPQYLPESPRREGHFDIIGAITSTVGMGSIVYGFVRAATAGWTDYSTVGLFMFGLALLAGFVLNELNAEQPITPLHLLASRERSGSNVSRLLIVGGMFTMFFYISQYLQDVLHFSPLKAGFAFLPVTGLLFTMVQVSPRITKSLAPATTVIIGLGSAVIGMFWLSQIGDSTPYFPGIALPMILLGAGMGTAFGPLTTLGISNVEPQDAGAASGLVNVSQQLGGSLGLAIAVTIFGSASRSAANAPIAAAGSALERSHEMAHGVGAALTGSVVFLTLAWTVMALVVRRSHAKDEKVTEPRYEAAVELAS